MVPSAQITIGVTVIHMNLKLLLLLLYYLFIFHKNFNWWCSRTPLSILSDLNNALILMVSIFSLDFQFLKSFSKPLGTVQSSPTTTVIIANLMFHSFLIHWQILSICPSFVFLSFSFFDPP